MVHNLHANLSERVYYIYIFDVYFTVIAFVSVPQTPLCWNFTFPRFPFCFRFHIWHASIWLIFILENTHKHTLTLSKWLKLIFIAPIYIYHPKKMVYESAEW